MDDTAARIASLSVEQRRLLELKLDQRARATAPEAIPTLRRHSQSDQPAVFPLSHAQEPLWVGEQEHAGLFPATPMLRLRGRLDVGALEASLSEICARHEALRTTFPARDGEPVQLVGAPIPVALAKKDLRELPPAAREGQAARLVTEEAQRPFDLSRDPMLRATLLRLAEEEHLLLLVIHHIVCDAWSQDLLFDELEALYRPQGSGRRAAKLPKLRVQYADYTVWQRQRYSDGALQPSVDYWKQQLSDDPAALDLPTDHPLPALRRRWESAWVERRLPASLHDEIEALCRRHGVTLYMALLAAWVTLLHGYSGQHDILNLTAIANRVRVELEHVFGLFAKSVVLRTNLAGDPIFTELLARARSTAIDALVHGEVPYQDMLAELGHELRSGFFMLPSATPKLEGLQVERTKADHAASVFLWVGMFIDRGDEGLTARLAYDPQLFGAASAHRMMEDFQALLTDIVAHPEQRVSALAMPAPPAPQHTLQGDEPKGGSTSAWRTLGRLRQAAARARRGARRLGGAPKDRP